MSKGRSARKGKARARGWNSARSPSPPCACGDAGEQDESLSEPEQIPEGSNSPSNSYVLSQLSFQSCK